MKRTTTHHCEKCGEETDLRGWWWITVTPSGKRFSLRNKKKVYVWWCARHYLTHMHNLYPFVCTKACGERQSKMQGIVMTIEDTIVWLDLAVAFVSKVPLGKGEGGVSYPMFPAKPKCPWCGKRMSMMKEPKS